MGPVLAEVVPLALGIAASPFPVVPAILLLFTARPRATAGAFLAGWFAGIVGVCAVAVILASAVEGSEETPSWAAWTKLALAVLLVLLGVRQWLTRGDQKEPAWMQALDAATPGSATRLGLLLSAGNPKILLLAATAGLAIGAADLTGSQTTGTVVAFTLIASSTVALPLLTYSLLGERILVPLGRVRDWLKAHNAAVVAVVLVVLGVLLGVEALVAL